MAPKSSSVQGSKVRQISFAMGVSGADHAAQSTARPPSIYPGLSALTVSPGHSIVDSGSGLLYLEFLESTHLANHFDNLKANPS